MDLKQLIDINTGKLKNAKWRKKAFEDAVKHVKISVNQNGLSEAKCDVEFYSTIEKILKTKSKSPALNEFLRVVIKDEWVRLEIQVIVDYMLKEQSTRFLQKCERWAELLKIDGGNTKHQVLVDLEKFIEYSNTIEQEEKGEGKNEKIY